MREEKREVEGGEGKNQGEKTKRDEIGYESRGCAARLRRRDQNPRMNILAPNSFSRLESLNRHCPKYERRSARAKRCFRIRRNEPIASR